MRECFGVRYFMPSVVFDGVICIHVLSSCWAGGGWLCAEVAAMRAVRQVEERHQKQMREMEAQLLQAANSASASELRVMLARRKIVEEILTLHCQRAGCGAAIFDW
jgi:hypothetical protein